MLSKVDWIGLGADDVDLRYLQTVSSPCGFSSINKPLVIWGFGGERNRETNRTPNECRGLPKSVSIHHTTTKALLYANRISKRNKQNRLNQNLAYGPCETQVFIERVVTDFISLLISISAGD
jgi:hypothetical protein